MSDVGHDLPHHVSVEADAAGTVGGTVTRSTVVASLLRRYRRSRALREIERLIRVAPAGTVRDDLMTIAARNDGGSFSWRPVS